MPRGLFDLMVLVNSYMARSDAYVFLLTETYPPFQDEQTRAAGTQGLLFRRLRQGLLLIGSSAASSSSLGVSVGLLDRRPSAF